MCPILQIRKLRHRDAKHEYVVGTGSDLLS